MLGYRIAVASKDGKVVTDHFGHCSRFSVIKVEDGQYHFVGFREVTPPCSGGQHTWEGITAVLEELKDCHYIIVNQIGGGALRILEEQQFRVIVHKGFIKDALDYINLT